MGILWIKKSQKQNSKFKAWDRTCSERIMNHNFQNQKAKVSLENLEKVTMKMIPHLLKDLPSILLI
jgi:hypothetical protein